MWREMWRPSAKSGKKGYDDDETVTQSGMFSSFIWGKSKYSVNSWTYTIGIEVELFDLPS